MKDVLGATINVGDTVLTQHYRSAIMDCVAEVEKVTKDKIHVKVPVFYVGKVPEDDDYRIVKRNPHQVVVITHQIKNNKKRYPENFI